MTISQEEYDTIEEILDELKVRNYTINDDGKVDVDGDVDISSRSLTEIPVQFGNVTGYFFCHNNLLTSLVGSPRKVGKSYHCTDNRITNLEGSPDYVGGYFDCGRNRIVNLKGCPTHIRSSFACTFNKLESLQNAPERIDGSFWCYNNELKSLEGSPVYVGGRYDCSNNALSKNNKQGNGTGAIIINASIGGKLVT